MAKPPTGCKVYKCVGCGKKRSVQKCHSQEMKDYCYRCFVEKFGAEAYWTR